MDLKQEFGFDAGLAAEGVWVSVDGNGTELLLAKMPNPRWSAFLEPHYRRAREMGTEVAEEIYEKALAKYVLLGWKRIQEEGKDIDPDLEENRLALINKYPPFKTLVMRAAGNPKNFQSKEGEEKN